MDKLVLTGPYAPISAHGCFAIHIDKPDPKVSPFTWEWDCYKKYADQVDKPPRTKTIRDGDKNVVAKVTYAVMSNALEASVQQVMLRLEDGQSPCDIYGEITACIGGFGDQGSVLFKRTAQTAVPCPDSKLILQLARTVVAVPCGKVLHIKVDLKIKTCNNQEFESLKVDLAFANGERYQSDQVAGNNVDVNIAWYPEVNIALACSFQAFSYLWLHLCSLAS